METKLILSLLLRKASENGDFRKTILRFLKKRVRSKFIKIKTLGIEFKLNRFCIGRYVDYCGTINKMQYQRITGFNDLDNSFRFYAKINDLGGLTLYSADYGYTLHNPLKEVRFM